MNRPDQFIRDQLKDKQVGIAGCGGLGSNIAIALARVGLGNLVIADFDVVDESNLNRQYYFRDQIGKKKATELKKNIERIDPSIKIDARVEKLDEENVRKYFKDCDIVVEAFDQADQKQMLIETMFEYMPDKPLVSGMGMAGWGSNETIRTEKMDNLYICGDQKWEVSENLPPLAPRVGIVANFQANLVLELLLGKCKGE